MRVRTSLILDEALLETIDEIAGEKRRRATIIECALREYIEREAKKATAKSQSPVKTKSAVSLKR